MSVIPEAAYEAVEKKLRQRDKLIRKAEEAVAKARARADFPAAGWSAGP